MPLVGKNDLAPETYSAAGGVVVLVDAAPETVRSVEAPKARVIRTVLLTGPVVVATIVFDWRVLLVCFLYFEVGSVFRCSYCYFITAAIYV